MRLITPEIAWHETLPIYSCDLQSRQSMSVGYTNESSKSNRIPLSELNFSSKSADTDSDANWTRLATAGGDNVVRLWRVRLYWSASTVEQSPTSAKKSHSNGVNARVPDHLSYLASLKRHEKPVNVVRWSPSGKFTSTNETHTHMLNDELGGKMIKFKIDTVIEKTRTS